MIGIKSSRPLRFGQAATLWALLLGDCTWPLRDWGMPRSGVKHGKLGNPRTKWGFKSRLKSRFTGKHIDKWSIFQHATFDCRKVSWSIASEDVDVLSTRFQNSETLPHLCRLLVSNLYYLGNSSPSHVFCFKLHVHHISVNTQKWNNKSLQY